MTHDLRSRTYDLNQGNKYLKDKISLARCYRMVDQTIITVTAINQPPPLWAPSTT